MNADREYAKKFLSIQQVAHVWGLKGWARVKNNADIVKNIKLEGSFSIVAAKTLLENLEDFFNRDILSQEGARVLREEGKQKILECMADSFPLSNVSNAGILAMIKLDKPFVILSGCIGHTVSIVLCKDQLVVCNRGSGRTKNAVEIFSLPTAKVTEEMIGKFKTIYPDMISFNKMISDLKLPSLGGYNHKDQKAGNCTWASIKAALGFLFRFYTNEDIGKKIYKQFTLFSRINEFLNYFYTSPTIEEDILEKVREKAKGKQELGLFKIEICEKYGVDVLEFDEFTREFGGKVTSASAPKLFKKAIRLDKPDFLQVLKDLGGDINESGDSDTTPLAEAIIFNKKIVHSLIKLGADVNKEYSLFKQVPLTQAIFQNDLATVKFLIKSGANVNKKDYDKITPLSYAIREGNPEIVNLLKQSGAIE